MREPPTSNLRNLVLQNIGRNVLNLQKMEGMFKSLAIYSEFSGPIEELPVIVEARRSEFSRKSLGQLVGDFTSRLAIDEPDELEEHTSEVPWINFRSTFVESEKSKAELEDSLAILVEERNSLIHQKLLSFEIEFEESCSSLLLELDEQHERIRPAYTYLQDRVNALNDMKSEIQAEIELKIGEHGA